jgi:hypothetical protein
LAGAAVGVKRNQGEVLAGWKLLCGAVAAFTVAVAVISLTAFRSAPEYASECEAVMGRQTSEIRLPEARWTNPVTAISPGPYAFPTIVGEATAPL